MEESFFLGFAERRSTLRLGSLDPFSGQLVGGFGWPPGKLVMSEIRFLHDKVK